MRISLLLVVALCSIETVAQRVVDVSKNDYRTVSGSLFYAVNGEPVVTTKFVKLVEGTPYFRDEWMKSVVVLPNGAAYKNVSVKLDLLENNLHYLSEKGDELIARSPVKEAVLEDEKTGELFRFVHSSALPATHQRVKEGWYLWLCGGKASLYKYFQKDMFAQKPYGSATEEQRIHTKEVYYLFYNGAVFSPRKPKDVPSLLANKKEELESFLKKENAAETLDDRFTALISYYNSLLP